MQPVCDLTILATTSHPDEFVHLHMYMQNDVGAVEADY